MTQTNNDYNRLNKLIKKNDKNLEGADIREGLTAILSISVPEKYLQFEGQTKGRLGTSEARSAVDQVVSEKLNYFLEENPDVAKLLFDKAMKSFAVREAEKKTTETRYIIKWKVNAGSIEKPG